MDSNKLVHMSFNDINPFVRFARFVPINHDMAYAYKKSYEYRMFYVYSGTGIITIDNKAYPSVKSDLFIFGPGVKYCFSTEAKNPIVLINFYFDYTNNHNNIPYYKVPSLTNEFDVNNTTELVHFLDAAAFNDIIHLSSMYSIEEILLEIVNEDRLHKIYYSRRMGHLFASALYQISRKIVFNEASRNCGDSLADSILDYIHNNYSQTITYRQIASQFNFHPNYINHIIVLHTGTSLHQYLINIRITKAIELIQHSNKTLTEIAGDVGYGNINQFSKIFKKKVGCCPSKLRKM